MRLPFSATILTLNHFFPHRALVQSFNILTSFLSTIEVEIGSASIHKTKIFILDNRPITFLYLTSVTSNVTTNHDSLIMNNKLMSPNPSTIKQTIANVRINRSIVWLSLEFLTACKYWQVQTTKKYLQRNCEVHFISENVQTRLRILFNATTNSY